MNAEPKGRDEGVQIMKRMIKMLLSSIFCLSILAGCSSSPYAKAEAQTLTIQGVPVYVEPDEETTQVDVDAFLKVIKTQPKFLMKNCTGIHLQGDNTYTEYAQQNFGVNDGVSVGYAHKNDVFLRTKLSYADGSKVTEDIVKETVPHELWHVFDYTNGNNGYCLSELDFNVFYNQNPGSISSYGARNVKEFFAEAGMMYLLSPEELKEKNIDVYNYFEALPKE